MSRILRPQKDHKKKGRPRKDKSRRTRSQYKLILERALFDKLQARATKKHISLSVAVREILFKQLIAGTELPKTPTAKDLEATMIVIGPEIFSVLDEKCGKSGISIAQAIVFFLEKEL